MNRRSDEEIIEFGCIRMEYSTRRIIDEFQTFVRPTRYPRLSQYCMRLTSITQQDVDTAPAFPEALANFVAWLREPAECTLCSWGAFDRYLLRQACAFHRLPYPFDDEYINIKPAFSDAFVGRGVNMERALEIAELPAPLNRHRAIDDARNAAALWLEVLRAGGTYSAR